MSVQTRERILRSACKVFAERGYHNTQIGHIINEAGIARGTFYLYFEGKDEIFKEILKRTVEDLKGIIKPVDPSKDIRAQLLSNLCDVFNYALENKDLARIVLYRDKWSPNSQIVDEFIGHVIRLVEGSLEKGLRMGILKEHNPRLLAVAIVGSIKEVIKDMIEKENPQVESICRELLEFGIKGIIKEV